MSAEEARRFVNGMYDSPWWRKKVAKMGDHQVIAIYLKEQAKAQERPKPPDPPQELF
jgi:hypothetical protein